MICLSEVIAVVFPEYNPNIDQLACVLREHRSPDSLVILKYHCFWLPRWHLDRAPSLS